MSYREYVKKKEQTREKGDAEGEKRHREKQTMQ